MNPVFLNVNTVPLSLAFLGANHIVLTMMPIVLTIVLASLSADAAVFIMHLAFLRAG